MANVLVEETSLQNIANSIREKTGTEDTYKPSEMATAISAIETGGGIEIGIAINEWDTQGRAKDISLIGMNEVPKYLFRTHSNTNYFSTFNYITNVNFSENTTEIGDSAFCNCKSLALTELPNSLTSIGSKAFSDCTSLALTELPNSLTSIGSSAFSGCTSLALTELPNGVTVIPGYCFKNMKSQKFKIKGDVTSIGSDAFGQTILNSEVLKVLSLPNVTSVPTMEDSFSNTAIYNKTGYIYVPDTLVDSFKSATNWSSYADQIKPISEMPTE